MYSGKAIYYIPYYGDIDSNYADSEDEIYRNKYNEAWTRRHESLEASAYERKKARGILPHYSVGKGRVEEVDRGGHKDYKVIYTDNKVTAHADPGVLVGDTKLINQSSNKSYFSKPMHSRLNTGEARVLLQNAGILGPDNYLYKKNLNKRDYNNMKKRIKELSELKRKIKYIDGKRYINKIRMDIA